MHRDYHTPDQNGTPALNLETRLPPTAESLLRIIITTPNALLQDVHDRMPVILPNDAYDLWFDPGFQKANAICDLLKPFDPTLMRRYEVSDRVNLVKNDDPACAEPVVRVGRGAVTAIPVATDERQRALVP